jgi:cytochrome P450
VLRNAKPYEAIPGPTILPIIGSSWVLLPVVGRYNTKKLHLANRQKRQLYGDIWREKFGHLNIVTSARPEDMENVCRNEGPYPNRGEFESIKAYRESRKQWYKSTGLIILQGKEWHDLRKRVQKHLMKPKAIMEYLVPMQEVAADFVKRMIEIKDSNNEVPNFLEELYKWALESVAVVGLDTRLGCLDRNARADSDGLRMINTVNTQFSSMNELEGFLGNIQFWKLFRTPKWKKFEKASDEFSKIAFKYINRSYEALKKRGEDDKDLTLLQAMCLSEGLELSGAFVTVADMLFAGIDTTSHTTGFLLYELAKNKDKQELLYEEVKQHIPHSGSITPEVYSQLRYLKACLKEVLRLHPIISFGARVLDHEIVVSGYRVPPKTIVIIALQEIYMDEKYFSNATQFIPERWQEKKENFNPFSYLPFGYGPRSCIGRRLAEIEMISIIAEIIRKFKVEYHYEDIDIFTRVVNIPDKPLRFTFIERT